MKREAVRVIRERFDYVQQFAPRAAASLRLNSARTLWGKLQRLRRYPPQLAADLF